MRVRVDVYVGDEGRLDISFLEKRTKWLPSTGVYLEFMLKGCYDKQINFDVSSGDGNVFVTRHSWNKFFVNVQRTDTVTFSVSEGGQPFLDAQYTFNVVEVEVPLMFSILGLLGDYSVSDVRFFANRLSENLVNSTRVQLFTPKIMDRLAKHDFRWGDTSWKLFELLLSILTERGITVYVTPFGQRVPYPLEFLERLKPVLWEAMENGKKFKLVWDFSEGLRKKELGGFVDAAVQRFGNDIPLVIRDDMVNKVGGEGFSYSFHNVKMKDPINPNERGIKILRVKEAISDFYLLTKFVSRAVQNGYGVEYVFYPKTYSLHKMHYSISRSLYKGYEDAKL